MASCLIATSDDQSLLDTYLSFNKPIKLGKKQRVLLKCRIRFKGERHADPSNIVKGVEDAIFVDDKHVDVQTRSSCGHEKGSVLVEIVAGDY